MNKLSALVVAAALSLPSLSWSMSSDGVVGPPSGKMNDATVRAMRLSQDGSPVTQDSHSRFLESSIRGNSYTCADLGGTAVATQAGLSATTPALVVWNPAASGVNAVINTASVGFTVIAATATFMLAVSTGVTTAPTATTAGQLFNNLIGSARTGQVACYRVSTLAVAPLMARVIGTVGMTANGNSAAQSEGQLIDRVDGELVLAPGELVTIQTTAAATVLGSITYEEVTQ